MQSRPKVYYGSPIRGFMGRDATLEYMAQNCKKAKKNIDVLQIVYPEVEWISVAPYDRIVQKLLASHHVSIEHVLEADFQLGDTCDGLLAHFWEPSGGAVQELDRQKERGKITLSLEDCPCEIWFCDWYAIEDFVSKLLISTEEEEYKDE